MNDKKIEKDKLNRLSQCIERKFTMFKHGWALVNHSDILVMFSDIYEMFKVVLAKIERLEDNGIGGCCECGEGERSCDG